MTEHDLTEVPTSSILKEMCNRFDAFLAIGTTVDDGHQESLEFCFHGTLTNCMGLVKRAEDQLYFELDRDDEEEEEDE